MDVDEDIHQLFVALKAAEYSYISVKKLLFIFTHQSKTTKRMCSCRHWHDARFHSPSRLNLSQTIFSSRLVSGTR